jgi:hypothetical protein
MLIRTEEGNKSTLVRAVEVETNITSINFEGHLFIYSAKSSFRALVGLYI